ncbi:MAG: FHA domain-containing protein [Planctomycetes bacterium]|nr:FHA domain-containing protein [Planctomycetota bacterium]
MSLQIRLIVGPNKGDTIELDQARSITLGRDPESDLVLPAPNASRNHSLLVWDGERLIIEDLESRNGVYVNANRIEGKQVLGPGDVAELGGCVFSIQGTTEATDFSFRKTVNLDEDENPAWEGGSQENKNEGTSGFKPSDSYDPETRTVDDEQS